MFWLALAAQLSLPVLARSRDPDVRSVFSNDDFPVELVESEVRRTVYTRTTVRPDGTIQGCVAEISSGDGKLDTYTCAIILKRAKFLPAKWTDGTPAFGVIRVPVRWVTDAPSSRQESLKSGVPDIDLSANQLPKGANSIVNVDLEIGADEKGRPVTCVEVPPVDKREAKHRFPELVPIACQQAMMSLSLRPATDDSGKPVRSVQSASVYFRLDH